MLIDSIEDPKLVALLAQGCVGVMPTDTVFGIVARAQDPDAVARLYKAKNREGKPGTIIAANVEQLEELGIAREYLAMVAENWPNPLSIVLPAHDNLAYIHQGKESLAVRVPKDKDIQALLEQTGPLLTSSANLPGEPPATDIPEAQEYFGDSIDFYVAGDTDGRLPSTVARLTPDGVIEILRQGAATIK